MNLEHIRMIPATGIERRTTSQLMVDAVEQENLLRRIVARVAKDGDAAFLSNDRDAAREYTHVLTIVVKEYQNAKRWADHYRAKVREELRTSSCANEEVPA